MSTKLLYSDEFRLLDATARVVTVQDENGKSIVVLNQTVFYPQGGGQPYDQGTIFASSGKFLVEEVRFADGEVNHMGTFEHGSFASGDEVEMHVDAERRILNARIHSAGHLIDKAIVELGLPWTPGKGYHYPNGPYDEYTGSLEGADKEKIKSDLEVLCNQYIQKGGKTEVVFMTREEMLKVCRSAPDFPDGKEKRARIVVHDGYLMPCGGTPVADLSEIGRMSIRKIKQEGDCIRIGYDVERTS